MRKQRAQVRKINLLFALELLDECVRMSSLGPAYVGSLTEQAVTEALNRARKRRRVTGAIKPRPDQASIDEALCRAA